MEGQTVIRRRAQRVQALKQVDVSREYSNFDKNT